MKLAKDKIKIILLLSPGIGLIAFFMTVVLFMVFFQSFGLFNYLGESKLSLNHWKEILSSRITWVFFLYSLRQGIFSALGAVFFAYPLALWLRKTFKGRDTIVGILRIPMLIPGLVAAFLFINIISYHGFLNEFLVKIGILSEPLRLQNDKYGIGVIALQVWKNMPFALLLLTSAIRGISSEVIDAAQDMGANKFVLLWRIIFPLTLPTMRAVLILIFIGALGDFSFNVIAGPRNLQSLSQYIVTLSNQLFQVNQSAVVTVLLMIAALIGIVVLSVCTEIFKPGKRGYNAV